MHRFSTLYKQPSYLQKASSVLSVAILALSLTACTTSAPPEFEPQNQSPERIQINAPSDYKQIDKQHTSQEFVVEFVPKQQTQKNWQDRLSYQVFYTLKTTPEQLFIAMQHNLIETCEAEAKSKLIKQGFANGYEYIMWWSFCPDSSESANSNFKLFKAIKGNQNFYLIHRDWRNQPMNHEIIWWAHVLFKLNPCDTERQAHLCKQTDSTQAPQLEHKDVPQTDSTIKQNMI